MTWAEVGGMEHGLAEISDTLSALTVSPDDPDISPSGMIRLIRMMATLAEPDEIANPA